MQAPSRLESVRLTPMAVEPAPIDAVPPRQVSEELESEDIASLPTLQYAQWQIVAPGEPPVLRNFAALFEMGALLGSGGFAPRCVYSTVVVDHSET